MKFAAVLVVNYLNPWYELTLDERIAVEHEHVFPSIGAFVKRGGEITPVRAIEYGRGAESFFILGFDEMDNYLDLVRELRSSRLLTSGLAAIEFETVGLKEAYFAERDKDRSAERDKDRSADRDKDRSAERDKDRVAEGAA